MLEIKKNTLLAVKRAKSEKWMLIYLTSKIEGGDNWKTKQLGWLQYQASDCSFGFLELDVKLQIDGRVSEGWLVSMLANGHALFVGDDNYLVHSDEEDEVWGIVGDGYSESVPADCDIQTQLTEDFRNIWKQVQKNMRQVEGTNSLTPQAAAEFFDEIVENAKQNAIKGTLPEPPPRKYNLYDVVKCIADDFPFLKNKIGTVIATGESTDSQLVRFGGDYGDQWLDSGRLEMMVQHVKVDQEVEYDKLDPENCKLQVGDIVKYNFDDPRKFEVISEPKDVSFKVERDMVFMKGNNTVYGWSWARRVNLILLERGGLTVEEINAARKAAAQTGVLIAEQGAEKIEFQNQNQNIIAWELKEGDPVWVIPSSQKGKVVEFDGKLAVIAYMICDGKLQKDTPSVTFLDGSSIEHIEPYKEQDQKPKIHQIKIHEMFVQPIKEGLKDWEYRKDDRDYEVGDLLFMSVVDADGNYTGDLLKREIVAITDGGSFGIPEDYVILSTKVYNE